MTSQSNAKTARQTEGGEDNTQPLHDLDHLVGRYLDLKHEAEEIASQMEHVKDQLREHGVGEHTSDKGVTVVVSPPARRFNAATAAGLLPEQTLAQCGAEGYDPKKLRSYLSPVLLEQCMDAGTGKTTVTVK